MENTSTPGSPQVKRSFPTLAVVITICITLIILCCITCFIVAQLSSSKGDQDTSNETNEQQTNSQSQSTENKVYPIGEYVQTANVEWKVKTAQDIGDTIESANRNLKFTTPDGHFIKVTYTVKNNGNEKVNPAEPIVLDSQDRRFSGYDGIAWFVDDRLIWDTINPGIESHFTAIYEMPDDATGLRLQVKGGDIFDEVVKYIDLGL